MNSIEARKGLKTFLLLLTAGGLAFSAYKVVPQGYNYLSSAQGLAQTRNHQIYDLTSQAVTIAWETDKKVKGTLIYGQDPNTMNRVAPEGEKRKAHRITVENLQPQTTYYYKIQLDDKVGGTVYQFTTLGE